MRSPQDLTEGEISRRLRAAGAVVEKEKAGLVVGVGDAHDFDALCPLIARLGRLTELHCVNGDMTDAGLARLSKHPGLAVLNIDGTHVTSKGLSVLAEFPALRKLICNLSGGDAQTGVANIAKVSTLASLSLGGDLCGCDVSPLGRLANLERLHLPETCEGTGIGQLKTCRKLADIALEDTGVGDDALRDLATLPLRKLHIGGTRVTNAGVIELERCRTLEELALNDLDITPRCLESLRKLPKLETLVLWGLTVDTEAANVLCHMGQLRYLYLDDASCPAERRERLATCLPSCRVDWRE